MNKARSSFNPWPVSIIAFFAVMILAAVSWIVYANSNAMELVTPDYYAQEIKFQDQIDRQQRAQHLGVQVEFVPGQQQITLALPADHAARKAAGHIHLYRPSAANLDRHLPLRLNASGTQTFSTAGLLPGLWKVRVLWSVDGHEFYHDQDLVLPAS